MYVDIINPEYCHLQAVLWIRKNPNILAGSESEKSLDKDLDPDTVVK
jgi:hypothetical protein